MLLWGYGEQEALGAPPPQLGVSGQASGRPGSGQGLSPSLYSEPPAGPLPLCCPGSQALRLSGRSVRGGVERMPSPALS